VLGHLLALIATLPEPATKPLDAGPVVEWATLAWGVFLVICSVLGTLGVKALTKARAAGKKEAQQENESEAVKVLRASGESRGADIEALKREVHDLKNQSQTIHSCVVCRKELDHELELKASRESVNEAFKEIRSQAAEANVIKQEFARLDERVTFLLDAMQRVEYKLDQALGITTPTPAMPGPISGRLKTDPHGGR